MVEHLLGEADDVLALVVVDQLQVLQCGDNVFLAYACLFTYFTEEEEQEGGGGIGGGRGVLERGGCGGRGGGR